jgi:alkanesulfonate monooxygenase SsuD/methylene tetrahydromethanopterin reductase-like flavin-dependent oxidoreductase (luciferase family)
VLSGGRVDVGIGRGYQSVEFDAFAVPLDEARERTDEAIEVLRALWTEDRVEHHGRFWDFDGVHLQPRPLQQPCPPLYYASVNIDSITHYAAKGIPFIVDSTVRTGRLAELADLWLGVARANDHSPAASELVAVRYVCLDDNDDAARDYVARAPKVTSLSTDPRLLPRSKDGQIAKGYEYWEKGWHGRDLAYYDHEPDWHDRWVAGGADRVITQLRALEAMGIGNVCCVFGLETTPTPPEEIERRMQRFATEVMPAFV